MRTNAVDNGEFSEIDNTELILDNLKHIRIELLEDKPFLFRAAREAHQLLLRSMAEALKRREKITILGKEKDRKKRRYYTYDGKNWKFVEKIKPASLYYAWLFSQPQDISESELPNRNDSSNYISGERDGHLIGFFEMLAMIQTECHMHRLDRGKKVVVTDEKMVALQWLHTSVRNMFEHYKPKFYYYNNEALIESLDICISIAAELLFESGTVLIDYDLSELKSQFEQLRDTQKYFSI